MGEVTNELIFQVSILLGEFMSQDLVPVDINHEQVYELKRHVPQDSRTCFSSPVTKLKSRFLPQVVSEASSAAASLRDVRQDQVQEIINF